MSRLATCLTSAVCPVCQIAGHPLLHYAQALQCQDLPHACCQLLRAGPQVVAYELRSERCVHGVAASQAHPATAQAIVLQERAHSSSSRVLFSRCPSLSASQLHRCRPGLWDLRPRATSSRAMCLVHEPQLLVAIFSLNSIEQCLKPYLDRQSSMWLCRTTRRHPAWSCCRQRRTSLPPSRRVDR